ncbi:hypothetical protein RBSH_04073 [Rhodopirellula baltica SH28]|uniref:Uncharacterized protein n=1 Tax=Rhodopirellula baltica SH28 TaxID=993517 RepID=K5E4A7_RHOBT|nr:hypothetical protein RBSH_04073 [Rhodopirellula baltica SH28]
MNVLRSNSEAGESEPGILALYNPWLAFLDPLIRRHDTPTQI